MTEGYFCTHCGQRHSGPPLSYGFYAPELWFGVPSLVQGLWCQLDEETCVIRNPNFFGEKSYFIKGNIEIPIHENKDSFAYTVWVSLSEKNFRRATQMWNDSNRVNEPPYFGWLSSQVWLYPSTINLKTQVHTREVGLRPLIELEPTNHPLAIEQRQGISMQRVVEIARLFEHGWIVNE